MMKTSGSIYFFLLALFFTSVLPADSFSTFDYFAAIDKGDYETAEGIGKILSADDSSFYLITSDYYQYHISRNFYYINPVDSSVFRDTCAEIAIDWENSARVMTFFGILMEEIYKNKDAGIYLEKALALDPDNARALLYYGWLFSGMDKDKYLDYSLRALALDPDYSRSYAFTSLAYIYLNKYQEAFNLCLECFSRFSERNSDIY